MMRGMGWGGVGGRGGVAAGGAEPAGGHGGADEPDPGGWMRRQAPPLPCPPGSPLGAARLSALAAPAPAPAPAAGHPSSAPRSRSSGGVVNNSSPGLPAPHRLLQPCPPRSARALAPGTRLLPPHHHQHHQHRRPVLVVRSRPNVSLHFRHPLNPSPPLFPARYCSSVPPLLPPNNPPPPSRPCAARPASWEPARG